MVAILPALGAGALTALGGFGANQFLNLFRGGGGGSSGGGGGGGGMDLASLQDLIAPPDFLSAYTEDKFYNTPTLSKRDLEKYEKAMDSGKIDKYSLLGMYDTAGLDPSDRNYYDVLTSTIGRPRGQELAGVIGQTMFRGNMPSRDQIKDAYKYAKVTGSLGSPKDAQQAMASFFALTNPEDRIPSSQELLAGMKYGPLVGTESGVFQFAGSPRTQEMIANLDKTKSFTSKKAQDIFNA